MLIVLISAVRMMLLRLLSSFVLINWWLVGAWKNIWLLRICIGIAISYRVAFFILEMSVSSFASIRLTLMIVTWRLRWWLAHHHNFWLRSKILPTCLIPTFMSRLRRWDRKILWLKRTVWYRFVKIRRRRLSIKVKVFQVWRDLSNLGLSLKPSHCIIYLKIHLSHAWEDGIRMNSENWDSREIVLQI